MLSIDKAVDKPQYLGRTPAASASKGLILTSTASTSKESSRSDRKYIQLAAQDITYSKNVGVIESQKPRISTNSISTISGIYSIIWNGFQFRYN